MDRSIKKWFDPEIGTSMDRLIDICMQRNIN